MTLCVLRQPYRPLLFVSWSSPHTRRLNKNLSTCPLERLMNRQTLSHLVVLIDVAV